MKLDKNLGARLVRSQEGTISPKLPVTESSSPPAREAAHEVRAVSGAGREPVHDLQAQIASRLDPRLELLRQAKVAEELGSRFVASVLNAAYRQLHKAPATEALITGWQGDPSAAAVAMRLNAALHLLARRAASPALTALYQGRHDNFDSAIGMALASHDRLIVAAMAHPTQTNEVGRAAALLSALLTVRRQFELPFELLEMGSSSGLNLNLGRYAYDLGGLKAGDQESSVKIRPQWRGNAPSFNSEIIIQSARGVDLNPLDPADPVTAERLMSYVWADQPVRRTRLAAALRLAQIYRPCVDRGNAAEWLAKQLLAPQGEVVRVVFHSMALQYFSPQNKSAVHDAIMAAATRATARQPLARISFEWNADRTAVDLTLSVWPGNETRILAQCEPYGGWIDWSG